MPAGGDGRQLGAIDSGQLRRETAEGKAERIVAEELKRLGWYEAERVRRRKGDAAKMAIAARLRKETTLTMKRIAQRMHLGTSHSAQVRLHEWIRSGEGRAIDAPI